MGWVRKSAEQRSACECSRPPPKIAAYDSMVPPPPRHMDGTQALATARATLQIEIASLHALAERLDEHFVAVVQAILALRGRVIVMGMGKSGHVGRKIAATLASTGTPAFFVHPAEASHGDLGMVRWQRFGAGHLQQRRER